jgi:hypothetical protein
MKTAGKFIIVLSEVLWTRQPPETTRAIQKLCRDFTVIYCARTYLSWYRVLIDKKARRAFTSNLSLLSNERFYSIVMLEFLPLGRRWFMARINNFLFSSCIRMISSLFLLYEIFVRSDSAVLTVWFFNPKHYHLISILHKHNVLLDTLDYFRLKPNDLGALLLRYTSSAFVYRNSVPLTSMERSMKLVRWKSNIQKRLDHTLNAIYEVLMLS